MKKLILFTFALSMILTTAVFGQGVNIGELQVTPWFGYSLGFGDAFKDYEESFGGFTVKSSADAGIAFGGMAHYGLSDKLAVGGEIFVQSYSFDSETTGSVLFAPYNGYGTNSNAMKLTAAQNTSSSNSETKMNFGASILYLAMLREAAALYFLIGAGFYDYGSTEIGFNFGLMYMKFLTEKMKLVFGPRFHYVAANTAVMMVTLYIGLAWTFPLGGQ